MPQPTLSSSRPGGAARNGRRRGGARRPAATPGAHGGPVAPARTEAAAEAPAYAAAAADAAAEVLAPTGGPLPSFAELGLPAVLVTALHRRGITAPFPIQAATLPDALAGRDVLGRGQTGSGKTLAFGLPMLARLSSGRTVRYAPRGLVLVPTRELAMQVSDALEPFAHALGLQCKVVVGGTPYGKQIDALRRGVDVVIATPGRLTDLVEQKACTLGSVEVTVLDEADHMADMGFLPQVRKLLDQVPADGQRLLFSATLDRDVDTLVRLYLSDPVTHSVAPASASVTTMEHHLLVVTPADKTAVVADIARRQGRTMMFVRTKHGADRLAKQLGRVGVSAGSLHGGKTQNARTRTLNEFRDGDVPVLVATDVAARGIHVDDVSLVVHVDPPTDSKDYLHRAGRTARAGSAGTVVTLVMSAQQREVEAMTRKAGIRPESTPVRPGSADLVRLTDAQAGEHPAPPARGAADDQPERTARPARSERPARSSAPRNTHPTDHRSAHGAGGAGAPGGRSHRAPFSTGRPSRRGQGGRPGR